MKERLVLKSILCMSITLLLFIPFEVFADNCWVCSLEVKVQEKIIRKYTEKDETSESTHQLDADGQVVFCTGFGVPTIIRKKIKGTWTDTSFRDTWCVLHQGSTKGTLLEEKSSAIWRLVLDHQSKVKPKKGCMQDPKEPIKGVEEQEELRFEGIVRPGLHKLSSLCKSVKETPAMGFCHETPQGYYGVMIKKMGPLPDKHSQGTGMEVYGWYALRLTRCDLCRRDSPINRCIGQYESCKEWANNQLQGCIALCELKRKNRSKAEDPIVPLITCEKECMPRYEKEMALCNSQASACNEAIGR